MDKPRNSAFFRNLSDIAGNVHMSFFERKISSGKLAVRSASRNNMFCFIAFTDEVHHNIGMLDAFPDGLSVARTERDEAQLRGEKFYELTKKHGKIDQSISPGRDQT